MTAPLRIGLTGPTGRMGLALLHAIEALPDANASQGLIRAGGIPEAATILARQGFSTLPLSEDPSALFCNSDVVIDFTTPACSLALLSFAEAEATPLVCGTTGFSEMEKEHFSKVSKTIPILLSSNTSIGVTVFSQLVEQAAKRLDEDYDIEIVEMHHRHKKDAPSGTALFLGEAAAKGRAVALHDVAAYERDGLRQRGSIGFASLRGGDVVGDHSVIFAGPGERFELTHKASSRDIFAHGALRAARWIVGQKPGLYSMKDVLGL